MNKLLGIGFIVLIAGGVSGYLIANGNFFKAETSTDPSTIPESKYLNGADPVDGPNEAENPTESLTQDIPPSEREPVNPNPVSDFLTFSPTEIRAQYKTLANQTITTTGIIKREIIADTGEPASNYLTKMLLADPATGEMQFQLQNSSGTYIECAGLVDTCMGYTDGETVTVAGMVIPLNIGFVFRLD